MAGAKPTKWCGALSGTGVDRYRTRAVTDKTSAHREIEIERYELGQSSGVNSTSTPAERLPVLAAETRGRIGRASSPTLPIPQTSAKRPTGMWFRTSLRTSANPA
jgi:hypothetical protein